MAVAIALVVLILEAGGIYCCIRRRWRGGGEAETEGRKMRDVGGLGGGSGSGGIGEVGRVKKRGKGLRGEEW
jgi:hypothetical protein